MRPGFDSQLGIWSRRRKWEGPFISCLSYPPSLGGVLSRWLSLPTSTSPVWGTRTHRLLKKSKGIPVVWPVISDALITQILADGELLWRCYCTCHHRHRLCHHYHHCHHHHTNTNITNTNTNTTTNTNITSIIIFIILSIIIFII